MIKSSATAHCNEILKTIDLILTKAFSQETLSGQIRESDQTKVVKSDYLQKLIKSKLN